MNLENPIAVELTTREPEPSPKMQKVSHALQLIQLTAHVEKPTPRHQQAESAALDFLTSYFVEE